MCHGSSIVNPSRRVAHAERNAPAPINNMASARKNCHRSRSYLRRLIDPLTNYVSRSMTSGVLFRFSQAGEEDPVFVESIKREPGHAAFLIASEVNHNRCSPQIKFVGS